jgi:hypothetical protein
MDCVPSRCCLYCFIIPDSRVGAGASLTNPTELTPEEHRIMEAIYWTQKEIWSNSARLEMLGLVEIEGGRRAAGEAGFFFGNTYGRAWWNTR